MKNKEIAFENLMPFYVKLKRSRMEKWCLQEMTQSKKEKRSFKRSDNNTEFMINKMGFYKKHAWFHFDDSINGAGWVPFKFVRNNYRRLNIEPLSCETNDKKMYFCAVKMMLNFAGINIDSTTFDKYINVSQYNHFTYTPQHFFNIFVNLKGSYKDLTNKSFRRVRSRLLRNRPVMLWIKDYSGTIVPIVVVGFNRRVFIYNDPLSGTMKEITVKSLNKHWRKCHYFALSY
ncbi:C39 family peptidase [Apilactobacillus xinyiensis]|uniref:C39 family peptidase n=1 Tax=Apilactobacillus xinyiensis TaxID=2841032 RepID=UPI001C7CD69C|nr:C39 family peptidase [Apilactobacillus xinyiensis]MCL0318301.1 C39 family peptidase [Apilactobacillus xinyiensis]